MAQEFTINSSTIESKINQLLPSQGGFGAGVDFSASTMVIPIVDLTESAEGSTLRQDLQTSFSHDNITEFNVENATTTIINTTGYFRVFGTAFQTGGTVANSAKFILSDGATDKTLVEYSSQFISPNYVPVANSYDFIVKLQAGDSLKVTSSATFMIAEGATRQIATIQGELV
jgi:hypothetical protein